ncbi:helix-turn-helix domain-containing protein [Escherichia coli]|uniref:helix-turn-helix domain-containing protein n=1 Tax=Escherichia coli TaxID=562 RepID=UPI000BB914AB|nr:helix-turn-helix domain-containing protein [Escherichia coli]EFN9100890.1 helix-turn-helix domain-containing protein [Escherichia coli]EIY1065387.1 helix-turn-helix domain-containing protein [Escherichia coli]ELD1760590.1 helix-turn-helix domain-containing protein [Escherichia coli]ELD1782751.1 helix-turn-helix domain-containing protein [Escherichia coli]ELJ4030373.1 helix-turn-helix domain-containing protein [Escherichia coli]
MSIICSFIRVERNFEVFIINDQLTLNYGDVLLVNSSVRTSLLAFSEHFTEVSLNEETVSDFIKNNQQEHKSHLLHRPVPIIKKYFYYPEILSELIKNIDYDDHLHPAFRKAILLSLVSIFDTDPNLLFFLSSCMPTFSGKVRNILLSDVSRQWKLSDISEYLYMSESLVKRKLFYEETSFSKILHEVRMLTAKKLLAQNHTVKHVAEKCGYSSPSYFVYLFRQYFNMTPRKFSRD